MVLTLALPIRVAAGGGLVALVADSDAEIAQSVALLLATRLGERRSVPDYGTPDPLFGGVDVDEVADAIATWEERADPALVEQLAEQVVEQSVAVYPSEQSTEEDE